MEMDECERANEMIGPNGASMRPNTPYLQHLVGHEFKGKNNGAEIMVYAVDEGKLSPNLRCAEFIASLPSISGNITLLTPG